jgi:hypothetical protein
VIVSIHQPAYLPWLGYLDKIARSDVFVLLDNVQFDRTWFTHRQYVKTPNGPVLLTIPVRKGHMQQTLRETAIADDMPWRRKHWSTIEQSYRKAPRWGMIADELRQTYAYVTERLTEFCLQQLVFWLEVFGIDTPIIRASGLQGISGCSSDLLAAICHTLGADTYLSGGHGRDYLETEPFEGAGIEIAYQNFEHPTYPQLHGEFVPRLGCLDLAANVRGWPS